MDPTAEILALHTPLDRGREVAGSKPRVGIKILCRRHAWYGLLVQPARVSGGGVREFPPPANRMVPHHVSGLRAARPMALVLRQRVWQTIIIIVKKCIHYSPLGIVEYGGTAISRMNGQEVAILGAHAKMLIQGRF